MSERNYDFLDRMIISLDQGVSTLVSSPANCQRQNPGRNIQEFPLSQTEQQRSASLMRVNHAGEVSAQALYQGQSITARDDKVKHAMKQSAEEETDHLAWCEQRIRELAGHTSYLNPVWYFGSFIIGAIAGLCGDKWSLGFIAETEKQVVEHLDNHLQKLPLRDEKSRAILLQMQNDESHHADVALQTGAIELPDSVKQAMKLTSKVMTSTAYWV